MKVEREESFSPIRITLETRKEVTDLQQFFATNLTRYGLGGINPQFDNEPKVVSDLNVSLVQLLLNER